MTTRVTVKDYAKMIGREYRTVLRWAKAGLLPAPAVPWTDPETGKLWIEGPLEEVG